MFCAVCSKSCSLSCANCHQVAYCSPTHQKQDWKSHKKQCKELPSKIYTILQNEKFGRYIVAARDIAPGEVIMKEKPIVFGPKQETLPICLGCHQQFNINANNRPIYYCSKCKTFPLCGPQCENMSWHEENECIIYAHHPAPFKITDLSKPHSAYESVLALRILRLKLNGSKKWTKLSVMESHNEERRKYKELWHRNEINTVKLLQGHLGFKEEVSGEEIHTILGYVDINSFEISWKNIKICGLYDSVYLMSHDCICNTHRMNDVGFNIVVRATVHIPKGQLISTIYCHTTEGTRLRRAALNESKFFNCACTRCTSPSELGTHLSSIKCRKCRGGYLLASDALDPHSEFRCEGCESRMSGREADEFVKNLITEGENVAVEEDKKKGSLIPLLEKFIKKHSGVTVHPNHFVLLKYICSLSDLYGRVKGYLMEDLNMEELKRKEEICHFLLRVFDVIEPGMTRTRGQILYELNAAVFFRAKNEFQTAIISEEGHKEKMEEVLKLLRESYAILQFDPPGSTEHKIGSSIPQSIEGVESIIKHFDNIKI